MYINILQRRRIGNACFAVFDSPYGRGCGLWDAPFETCKGERLIEIGVDRPLKFGVDVFATGLRQPSIHCIDGSQTFMSSMVCEVMERSTDPDVLCCILGVSQLFLWDKNTVPQHHRWLHIPKWQFVLYDAGGE